MNDPQIKKDSTSKAFIFPRKSSAILAHYHDNTFTLQTSRIKNVTIYVSPEMVSLKQPVRVIINGKTVYEGKVKIDKDFMLDNYTKEVDHQALWVNRLTFKVE